MEDTLTGGVRMKAILESGRVNKVGQCIDLYNQNVIDDCFVAITTRVDTSNLYWVTVDDMRVVKPLNPDDEGLCRTLKAQYAKNGFQNFFRDGSYAATGVIEFDDEEMSEETARVLQIGSIREGSGDFKNQQPGRVYSAEGISPTIMNTDGGGMQPKIIEPQVLAPKRTEFGKKIRKAYEAGKVKLQRNDVRTFEPRNDGISNTITTAEKDNILVEPMIVGYTRDRVTGEVTDRHLNDVANTIHCSSGGGGNTDQFVAEPGFRIRKLTERECFRLQGVSDDDIDKIQNFRDENGKGISRTRQYAMAGNSITVDVLSNIFRKLFIETGCEDGQLSLF